MNEKIKVGMVVHDIANRCWAMVKRVRLNSVELVNESCHYHNFMREESFIALVNSSPLNQKI